MAGNKRLGTLERYAKLQFNQTLRPGFTLEQRDLLRGKAIQKYVEVYKGYLTSNSGPLRIARAAYNLANCYMLSDNVILFRVADALYQQALPYAKLHRHDNNLPYNIQLEHGLLCGRVMRFEQAEQLLLDAIRGFARVEKDLINGPNNLRDSIRGFKAKQYLADLYWNWRRFDESETLYRQLFGCGAKRDEKWLTQNLNQEREGFLRWKIYSVIWKVVWIISSLFYLSAMP